MAKQTYDLEGHAMFVTFSCKGRRRFLSLDQPKRIVLGTLADRLTVYQGVCAGYVIMLNHVHAIVWLGQTGQFSDFMGEWKSQSSFRIRQFLKRSAPKYLDQIAEDETIWQHGSYDFNLYSEKKLEEKLDYMHQNPVHANLVERAVDWKWSSARWYESRQSVGIEITPLY